MAVPLAGVRTRVYASTDKGGYASASRAGSELGRRLVALAAVLALTAVVLLVAGDPSASRLTAGSTSVYGVLQEPGEELAAAQVENRRIADVIPILRQHHVAAKGYMNAEPTLENGVNTYRDMDSPPKDWYVHRAQPWSPGEVLLWIGPQRSG